MIIRMFEEKKIILYEEIKIRILEEINVLSYNENTTKIFADIIIRILY